MSENPVLRLKMRVTSVIRAISGSGDINQEQVELAAVYSDKEGSANARWSKYTPYAKLNITINNPLAFGKVLPDQFVFVDLTLTDKDSL